MQNGKQPSLFIAQKQLLHFADLHEHVLIMNLMSIWKSILRHNGASILPWISFYPIIRFEFSYIAALGQKEISNTNTSVPPV